MRPSYEDLEDEVRVLRQRLADLSGVDMALRIRSLIPLTSKEARVLAVIYSSGATSKESLYARVFEHANGEGPEGNSVAVMICRLRIKLTESRVPGSIDTIWGEGFAMSQPMRSWLSERLEGRVAERLAA